MIIFFIRTKYAVSKAFVIDAVGHYLCLKAEAGIRLLRITVLERVICVLQAVCGIELDARLIAFLDMQDI